MTNNEIADKYWGALNALARHYGHISIDAAFLAIKLAVDETAGAWEGLVRDLEQRIRIESASSTRVCADIEALQTDYNAEAAILRSDIAERDRAIDYQRDRIVELRGQADALRASVTEQETLIAQERHGYEHKCAELVTSMAQQDSEIQAQRAEIGRLTLRCQELTEQLEIANSRPMTLTVAAGSAPAAIDWSGAPKEYRNSIDKLNAGTLPGWTILTVPQRRAIALYAVAQLSADGVPVTMAQFDAARPAWMPSASAIAKLFETGWTDVVKQAVRHA